MIESASFYECATPIPLNLADTKSLGKVTVSKQERFGNVHDDDTAPGDYRGCAIAPRDCVSESDASFLPYARHQFDFEQYQILASEVVLSLIFSLACVSRHRLESAYTTAFDAEPSVALEKQHTLRECSTTDYDYVKALGLVAVNSDRVSPTKVHRSSRRTVIVVEPGETLVSIAEKFFHDPGLSWLIADCNMGFLNEELIEGRRVVHIRVGQNLRLPMPNEIETFLRRQTRNGIGGNVVTIQEQTFRTATLVESELNQVLVPNPPVSRI